MKGCIYRRQKRKTGQFEIASGGTLFLDEIGNLTPAMQVKLLTAIEKQQVVRLGSTTPYTRRKHTLALCYQCRYSCHGRRSNCRQDLLYRMNTIELHIPPLRERGKEY